MSIQNIVGAGDTKRRHLMGDALTSLTVKELKQLENRLERGITRIRSKKHELLFAEIEYMQKREVELQNDNLYLRAKLRDIIIREPKKHACLITTTRLVEDFG
ncbi:Agamous-like MADS-box protein agl11 [Asimina triloba]